MKIRNDTTQILPDALLHCVCIGLQFRSSVLGDSPSQQKNDIRPEDCCPAKP